MASAALAVRSSATRLATLVGLILAALTALHAWAAADLPTLSGRVVDNASLLSADAENRIESKLRTLEDQSGIQFVVATVPSLGGEEIEPYANRLFRAWKLGEQKRNNGVLLLIAPKERKARIEVGYGLEGTLTDALSKLIITNGIAPKFRSGDFAGSIESGVDDTIAVLSSDKAEWEKRPHLKPQEDDSGGGLIVFVVLAIIVVIVIVSIRRGGTWTSRPGGMIVIPTGSGTGADWTGGASSGGISSSGDSGFSGGGGSSGGGGASGDL